MAAGVFGNPFASRLSDHRKIPSLDGLRAISIGFVLFAHLSGTQFFPSFVIARRSLGNYGVRMFFVLSGFLITTLLLQELASSGRISLKSFYLRRVFRILPAKYFYILATLVATLIGWIHVSGNDFMHALTYTANYDFDRSWYVTHLWSLAVEEQFYLIWPVVLALTGSRKGMWVAASMIAVSPLLRTIALFWLPAVAWPIGASFQANADALASGCILAGFRGWLWDRGWYRKLLDSPAFVIVPVISLAVCTIGFEPQFNLTVGITIMNITIALCIDRCVRFDSDRVGRALNHPLVSYVGVLSYSIYLWQQPFLNRLSTSPISWFPMNLLFVVAAAVVSYHLVEKPFLQLRRSVEQRLWPTSMIGRNRRVPSPVSTSEEALRPKNTLPQSQQALPNRRP